MRDIKTEHDQASDEFWPTMSSVFVQGDRTAARMPEGATQEQGEQTVQTWQRVTVLEVTPAVPVFWGFRVGDHAQFMNVPVQFEEGKFGVRVGDGDVNFLSSRLI